MIFFVFICSIRFIEGKTQLKEKEEKRRRRRFLLRQSLWICNVDNRSVCVCVSCHLSLIRKISIRSPTSFLWLIDRFVSSLALALVKEEEEEEKKKLNSLMIEVEDEMKTLTKFVLFRLSIFQRFTMLANG